jgi:hypothetical protein
MSGSRVILLILVALAVLFAVGMVMGVGNNTESVNPKEHSWSQLFKEKFIKEETLNVRDISAGCLSNNMFTILASSTCHAEVKEDEARVRTMQLRLIEGDRVQVKLEPKGDNAVPLQVNLRHTDAKPLKLQIFRGEEKLQVVATLSLKCEGASGPLARCTVHLQ